MEEFNPKKESKEKPSFLYHASPNSNIEEFEPRNKTTRNKDEGPKIFATPSREVASIFLVPTDDSWAGSGNFGGAWYFFCNNEERFKKLDKGSTLYQLSSDGFSYDADILCGSGKI